MPRDRQHTHKTFILLLSLLSLALFVLMLTIAVVGPSTRAALNRMAAYSQKPAADPFSARPTGWKTYHNPRFGFDLQYPPDFSLAIATSTGTVGLVLVNNHDD